MLSLSDLLNIITTDDNPTELMQKAKEAFSSTNLPFSKPYLATVTDIYSGTKGKHTGLYFIFQKSPVDGFIYYYIGIATRGNTVTNRFQPHYAKLTVDLAAMYGNVDTERKETRWQFPKNWRSGVKQHFLNNPDDIPDYWSGKQKKDVIKPANLDWKPDFKVDVKSLPVLIWDLTGFDAKQIDALETAFVRVFNPFFNGSKRIKQKG